MSLTNSTPAPTVTGVPVVDSHGAAYGFPQTTFDVAYCEIYPPEYDLNRSRYNGYHPGTIILLSESRKEPYLRPLTCDIVFRRDEAVPMRDGAKLYADIFHPTHGGQVPAIIAYGPYGKTDTGDFPYDRTGPYNCGIDPSSLSGYHKFEGPDPVEWVPRDYAIVHVDSRGSFNSDGHIMRWGPQEARDVHDTVDWCSKQPWCSGAVTMCGNSWLAVSQITAAAREPHPALKCIAPWEGHADHYRDVMVRGGIPQVAFGNWMQGSLVGRNKMEDTAAQAFSHPFFDEYWQTKRVPVENIDIPMYLLGSYSSFIHTHGSLRTFRDAKSSQKWIRIHNGQEWSDLYKPNNVEDLARFYDRFLKNIDNGWERDTPKVRLTLLSFTGKDIIERPESEYPLSRQKLVRYHLNAKDMTLVPHSVGESATTSYDAHHLTACVDFKLKFDKYTEIAGYPFVKLWVSCNEHDDLDVRVQLRKMSAQGELLEHLNFPTLDGKTTGLDQDVNIFKFLGNTGMLRASHRVTKDEALSTVNEPFYKHDRREPVPPGTVVPLEIGFWPTGLVFEKDEYLVLRVAGHSLVLPEFKIMALKEPIDFNKGIHVIHTGGDWDSHLLLPVIN